MFVARKWGIYSSLAIVLLRNMSPIPIGATHFFSVGCFCWLLAANIFQGYEDDGFNAEAVVQEGP